MEGVGTFIVVLLLLLATGVLTRVVALPLRGGPQEDEVLEHDIAEYLVGYSATDADARGDAHTVPTGSSLPVGRLAGATQTGTRSLELNGRTAGHLSARDVRDLWRELSEVRIMLESGGLDEQAYAGVHDRLHDLLDTLERECELVGANPARITILGTLARTRLEWARAYLSSVGSAISNRSALEVDHSLLLAARASASAADLLASSLQYL